MKFGSFAPEKNRACAFVQNTVFSCENVAIPNCFDFVPEVITVTEIGNVGPVAYILGEKNAPGCFFFRWKAKKELLLILYLGKCL